ncbi:hypothetical protein HanHA300_Chr13g0473981 [Helianthus annuus]|nr:hypothetical protein HanHA300_Chr13g0473981 [Helianthus annuus]KAJ0480242.1 hypothetical protein HanIR_Chr13g0629321 [Helianthus annuus]KAJ0496960.1 hypothetical protein HanHA89_Chr13g0505901 [Helianthus annuus]KAJ0662990.1 hypothetical protein HanLR1_Chr13g0476051 [Helianthus annuus]
MYIHDETVVNQGRLIHWSRQVGLIHSFRGSVAGSSADLSPAQGKHTVTRNKEDGEGGACDNWQITGNSVQTNHYFIYII